MAKGWIVSARYDTAFFTASLVVPFSLWAAFSANLMTGVAVYVTFQLLFNMPHNFQTWTLTVLDQEDRAKNWRVYVTAAVTVVLVLGVPMVVSPNGLYPWVRDGLIYWGYYHLVRQHYGFQRLYERKMGGVTPSESFWYGRYLDVVSYVPLLLRFRDPELMTFHVGSQAAWVHHPVLPSALVGVLAAVYAGAILGAVVHHVVAFRAGRQHLLPRALLLAAVTTCFMLAGLVINDIIIAIAIVTSFHNLQYLGLLAFHNKNRAALGDVAGNRFIGWIAAHRWWPTVGVSVLYGVLIMLPRVFIRESRLGELPLAFFVAMHYYVDSRVWRFKDYPKRGAWLQLNSR